MVELLPKSHCGRLIGLADTLGEVPAWSTSDHKRSSGLCRNSALHYEENESGFVSNKSRTLVAMIRSSLIRGTFVWPLTRPFVFLSHR